MFLKEKRKLRKMLCSCGVGTIEKNDIRKEKKKHMNVRKATKSSNAT